MLHKGDSNNTHNYVMKNAFYQKTTTNEVMTQIT